MNEQNPVTYWILPEKKKMLRRINDTQADLLVVFGRDLTKEFDHRHTRVTYPSAERLNDDLKEMQASNADSWELLMNEYLQVNKVKLERMAEYRQRKFDQTGRVS